MSPSIPIKHFIFTVHGKFNLVPEAAKSLNFFINKTEESMLQHEPSNACLLLTRLYLHLNRILLCQCKQIRLILPAEGSHAGYIKWKFSAFVRDAVKS